MEAKQILYVDQYDCCWDALAEKYEEAYSIEDILELARTRYPEVMRGDDEAVEVEGEVQGENERYILTWEDGMSECMRVYQKPPYNTKTYYAFMWGEGTIEETELTPEEFAEMKEDCDVFETREEAEQFAKGE